MLQDAALAPTSPDAAQARPRSAPWLAPLMPSVALCAIGALGFAYATISLQWLCIAGKTRDLDLYIIGSLLLAPFCAAVQRYLVRPDFRSPQANPAETVNYWAAA